MTTGEDAGTWCGGCGNASTAEGSTRPPRCTRLTLQPPARRRRVRGGHGAAWTVLVARDVLVDGDGAAVRSAVEGLALPDGEAQP